VGCFDKGALQERAQEALKVLEEAFQKSTAEAKAFKARFEAMFEAAHAEAKAEAEADVKVEGEVKSQAEAEAEVKVEGEAAAEAKAKAEVKAKAKAEAEVKGEAEAEAEVKVGAKASKAKAETEAVLDWMQYSNNPWFAACSAFQAPPDDGASLGMQGTPSVSDLMLAIEEVSSKIPTVSWRSAANAMKASLTLMVQEERSVDAHVVAFAKECMYQVLHVMVGLNTIVGKPKTMTDLQEMWKEKVFDKFNSCFHEGLACAMRVSWSESESESGSESGRARVRVRVEFVARRFRSLTSHPLSPPRASPLTQFSLNSHSSLLTPHSRVSPPNKGYAPHRRQLPR